MDLGAFSVSLSVADMAGSREFYGALGFEMVGGDGESWTIMANGTTVIGLFHGMFEGNLLTFNPGWTGVGDELPKFTDIRAVEERLLEAGIATAGSTTADAPTGPASFTVTDPDGNVILFDQHR